MPSWRTQSRGTFLKANPCMRRNRDLVQNAYIRRCARVDGRPFAAEFDTVEQVRDPSV